MRQSPAPDKPRLVLFARYPTPGEAKTRLIPALGAEGAARLHERLTERALGVLRASGLPVELRSTGAEPQAFQDWLGGVAVVDQGGGGLGERMRRAAAPYPSIMVGSDIPDLGPDHIEQAVAALADHDVVLGPAEDGGYYLIGLRRPLDFLFADMPWGTDAVFAETLRRLRAHDVAPALLEPLADLDRPEDLARWPDLA